MQKGYCKMNTQTNKKKIIIRIGIILLSISVLAVVLRYLFNNKKADATFRNDDLVFAEADYETDILKDPFYLMCNRDVIYTVNGDSEPINSDNVHSFGDCAKLFLDYFDTVIKGDCNTYPSFFTEEYKRKNRLPEKFTMQRLYDIEVSQFSSEVRDYNGKQVLCTHFIVSYRIQYNNGTFRGDFNKNDMKPLLFSLLSDNGKVLIYSVSEIKN